MTTTKTIITITMTTTVATVYRERCSSKTSKTSDKIVALALYTGLHVAE